MRIKDYFINKSFLSLTVSQVLGSWVFALGATGSWVLILDYALKRILMITRKNNLSMRKLNDNIDHNNVVIIWISLCLQMKQNNFL